MRAKADFLARDKLAWLLAVQILVIMPLLLSLPIWLWLVWALSAFWRIQMYRGHWGAPRKLLKTLLTLGCIAALYLTYSGRTGTETMVGLLVCTFVLKLLEVNSPRDAQLLIFIGFILSATQLLFSQTPLAASYTLFCCIALTACWRSLYLMRPQSVAIQFKRSAMILCHCVPMLLILFVVLPRLAPLWAIPDQQTARTGFSETLSPGDLGRLVLSEDPAFRVEFNGPPPDATTLYWRGLIMDTFDGRSWRLGDTQNNDATGQTDTVKNNLIDYTIIAEPHGHYWLFSLMTPLSATSSTNPIRLTPDSLLMARYPLAQRLRYEVSSALAVSWPTAPQLSAAEKGRNTRLPPALNPRTQALVSEWKQQGLGAEQITARALQLFNKDFSYTLEPSPLGLHAIDDFLFTTKSGFCEHFASSFAFLMRAAGIPARVVVGYQGGQWNEIENYLLVSQADAHAWTEIWLDGKGWQTIDPTGAVAPGRIGQRLSQALNAKDQTLIASGWKSSLILQELQKRLDAAGYVWQRWVLSYDNDTQEGLLNKLLGGSESWRITVWLIGFGLMAAGLFAWVMQRSRQTAFMRPETKTFKQLEQKLLQLGYPRNPGETVQDFTRRIALIAPAYRSSLQKIAELFDCIAYQEQREYLPQLQQLIRKFPRGN